MVNTLCEVSTDVSVDAACCGTAVGDSGLCFDDFFCAVKQLYPDFQGQLCEDGVLDRTIKSLVKPLYDAYVRRCGLLDVQLEVSPLSACCTLERWYDDYGIPDRCFDADNCFPDDDIQAVTRRAQLIARVMLEYNAIQNAAFYERVASLFGLEITLRAPTFLDGVTTACETYTAWTGSPKPPPSPEDCKGLAAVTFPAGCRRIKQQFVIDITCAPQTTINMINCGRIGQPIAYNYYVQAFECLVRELKPCHVDVCFVHSYTTNECAEHANPCSPPSALTDPCPHPSRYCATDSPC